MGNPTHCLLRLSQPMKLQKAELPRCQALTTTPLDVQLVVEHCTTLTENFAPCQYGRGDHKRHTQSKISRFYASLWSPTISCKKIAALSNVRFP